MGVEGQELVLYLASESKKPVFHYKYNRNFQRHLIRAVWVCTLSVTDKQQGGSLHPMVSGIRSVPTILRRDQNN